MDLALGKISAIEILDSRGRPTVRAGCQLQGNSMVWASVPSGASTGAAEALELRDGGKRYGGLGCRQAVANINGPIAAALAGKTFSSQEQLDRTLLELDGSPNKSRLGANALLAVSIAFARACAAARDIPLYQQFADILSQNGQLRASGVPREQVPWALEGVTAPGVGKAQMGSPSPLTFPRMTINLFSGGKHAGGQVAIQDVLVVPSGATTIEQGLEMVYGVYQAAAALILRKYGMRALRADEGGLAPPFPNTQAMLEDAVEAIHLAGYKDGRDVALAVDVASSHFYADGKYLIDGQQLSAADMIQRIAQWVGDYPIVSVEDGLAEDDWDNWPHLCSAIGASALVLGDDLLCTNPQRISRAVESGAANALLLKVNQIGTLTEAAESCRLARCAGWAVTISARSGETEDNWLADLSVGWRGDQIKVGSITQSERLAKYNRLLEIEAQARFYVVEWPRA